MKRQFAFGSEPGWTDRATLAGAVLLKSAQLKTALLRTALLSAALLGMAGCHSSFVETTLVNRSGRPLHLVELDYPSASFGTEVLAPDTTFHYRFKIIGEGPVKLSWTDEGQKEHNVEGPRLHEGQRGLLTVTVGHDGPDGQVRWQTSLQDKP